MTKQENDNKLTPEELKFFRLLEMIITESNKNRILTGFVLLEFIFIAVLIMTVFFILVSGAK